MSAAKTWRRTFFAIYVGQSFSLLSSSAVQFSIIWWIALETRSALSLTFASVAGLLPQAVLGIFAGVLIDRFPRKKMIVLADCLVALSSLILGILFFAGLQSLAFVYAALFARAVGETFHKPALQALIPEIVPPADLVRAGGFGQMISTACALLGPMLGALLMSVASLPWALLVDVFGASLAVAALSIVKSSYWKPAHSQKLNVWHDMKQGFLVIRPNKPLLRLSIPMLASTVAFVPLATLLPLMVLDYFSGTPWQNGLVQTLFSAGMLTAALVLGVTGGSKRQFLMISLSTGLLGLASMVSGLIPSGYFWLFCFLVFLMGACGAGFNIPFTAYVQRTVPAEHLGKVLSLIASVMSFAAPAGMFLAGPAAEFLGIGNWMILSGILMVLIGMACHLLTREFDQSSLVERR